MPPSIEPSPGAFPPSIGAPGGGGMLRRQVTTGGSEGTSASIRDIKAAERREREALEGAGATGEAEGPTGTATGTGGVADEVPPSAPREQQAGSSAAGGGPGGGEQVGELTKEELAAGGVSAQERERIQSELAQSATRALELTKGTQGQTGSSDGRAKA